MRANIMEYYTYEYRINLEWIIFIRNEIEAREKEDGGDEDNECKFTNEIFSRAEQDAW